MEGWIADYLIAARSAIRLAVGEPIRAAAWIPPSSRIAATWIAAPTEIPAASISVWIRPAARRVSAWVPGAWNFGWVAPVRVPPLLGFPPPTDLKMSAPQYRYMSSIW